MHHQVQGFVIEFAISLVLVLVVFGAAADEEASNRFSTRSAFKPQRCAIIITYLITALAISITNPIITMVHKIIIYVVIITSQNYNQASKNVLGSPPLAIGLAITACHLFAVGICIWVFVLGYFYLGICICVFIFVYL